MMVGRCDYFHSSRGYSSFVTCLLGGWTPIYSTRVRIIACSPVALPLLLYLSPMSFTLALPLRHSIFSSQAAYEAVSAARLIKA